MVIGGGLFMNANELAHYVDARETNNPHLKEAATMLRQLQAENEALLLFITERGETGQLIIWKAQEKWVQKN